MDNIYESLSRAETGGEENPYIRTKVQPPKGSSAFGPTQITMGLINGALKNNLLSPQTEKFAKEVMVPMQEKMLEYGGEDMVPGMEQYDYGQTGGFDVEKYSKEYEQLSKELINILMEEVAKEAKTTGDINIGAFLKKWRGKEPDKGYKERFYNTPKR